MPEKTINEISRDLRDLYEKGNAAAQRDNFDYALLFYNQVLQKEPGFLECRQALRNTQIRKAGNSSSFFKKVMGTAGSSPQIAKTQVLVRTKPIDALASAEQILNSDPTNGMALKLLATAALSCDLPKTAVFALETVRKANPDDRDTALGLALAYIGANQANRAEAIYTELYNKSGQRDQEVAGLLKDLSARRTLNEKGYEALADGKGSYRDILKDKNESVSLEQEKRQVKSEEVALKLIDEYEEKLRTETGDFRLARQVADLYAQIKNYDKALSYYRQLLAIEGVADAAMERTYTDLMIKKFDQRLAQLDPQAPDYAEQVAQIQGEKDIFILADCQRRMEKYPNDLQIRFELGQLYLKVGKVAEAIQEFQKAQNNPHRRLQSMMYMAKCFASTGKNDMAARKLQDALKEKVGFDEERKEMIYDLGSILEKMGKKEEAMDQFKQIYEIDIGYRDVAKKVDDYYSGQG